MDLKSIRARCSQSVTDMVSGPSEYYRSQQILRDRDELLAEVDRLSRAYEVDTGEWRRQRDLLQGALETLLPGLVLDLRYANLDDDKDAMQSRIETVTEALAGLSAVSASPVTTENNNG